MTRYVPDRQVPTVGYGRMPPTLSGYSCKHCGRAIWEGDPIAHVGASKFFETGRYHEQCFVELARERKVRV